MSIHELVSGYIDQTSVCLAGEMPTADHTEKVKNLLASTKNMVGIELIEDIFDRLLDDGHYTLSEKLMRSLPVDYVTELLSCEKLILLFHKMNPISTRKELLELFVKYDFSICPSCSAVLQVTKSLMLEEDVGIADISAKVICNIAQFYSSNESYVLLEKLVDDLVRLIEDHKSNTIISLRLLTLTSQIAFTGEQEFLMCEKIGANAAMLCMLHSSDDLSVMVSVFLVHDHTCICYYHL